MKRRPLMLTGPYLAMWLWLAVPLTLFGLVPLTAMSNWQLSLHLGGWIEEVNYADNPRDVLRIMRKDRTYSECRTARFGNQITSFVVLPAKNNHCPLLRFTRSDSGRVVGSISNAELIEGLKRGFR